MIGDEDHRADEVDDGFAHAFIPAFTQAGEGGQRLHKRKGGTAISEPSFYVG